MTADVTTIATDLQFPEGPIAMDDGSILLVEIKRGTLTWLEADGEIRRRFDVGGGPNGAAIGPDGKAYVCNNGGCFHWEEVMGLTLPGHCPPSWNGGAIQRVDLETGEVETLYTESTAADGSTVPLRAPNDIVFDAHGGFWFSDHGVRLERTSDRTGPPPRLVRRLLVPRGRVPGRLPERHRPLARRLDALRRRDPQRSRLPLAHRRSR